MHLTILRMLRAASPHLHDDLEAPAVALRQAVSDNQTGGDVRAHGVRGKARERGAAEYRM
jgi:hypothetical protein